MDKFGLFDFISKLSTDKEAQNSINTVIGKLFSNGKNASKNSENVKTEEKVNVSSDVYRSPSSYTLYSDMIKRHDEISKTIKNNNENKR